MSQNTNDNKYPTGLVGIGRTHVEDKRFDVYFGCGVNIKHFRLDLCCEIYIIPISQNTNDNICHNDWWELVGRKLKTKDSISIFVVVKISAMFGGICDTKITRYQCTKYK